MYLGLAGRGALAATPLVGIDPGFGGGYVPPNAQLLRGETEIVHKVVGKFAERLSKCYRQGVEAIMKNEPDHSAVCLDSARFGGTSPGYDQGVERLMARGQLDACFVGAAVGSQIEAFIQSTQAQVWCDSTSGVQLPIHFGGGYLPNTSQLRAGESRVGANLARYWRSVSKCYRRGVKDAFKSLPPDRFVRCLGKADLLYAKRAASISHVPACLDAVALRASFDAQIRGLNAQIFCAQ